METRSRLEPRFACERRRHWLQFLLCCFVGICGLRWFLIERFAAPVAWGDDLDGIARLILLPFEQGTLTWSAMVSAHNGDHRIVATRGWEILWYVLNGSWDPKLVMMTKAVVYAAAATIFIHIIAGALPRRRFMAGAVLAVLFAFPFAFANMIWAFQSQFDFFLLAAALGWWALLEDKPVAALASAGASILMLAAGPVLAASYVPFFAMSWWTGHWRLRKAVACCAAAGAIVALGLASPTAARAPHTGTPGEKLSMLARIYAWPHSNLLSIIERLPETERYVPAALMRFPSPERSWLLQAAAALDRRPWFVVLLHLAGAMILIAPSIAVAVGVARRRVPLALAMGPLALNGFAFLMIAATAVARANQVTVAPRFLDHVALAGFASIACCFVLLARSGPRRWFTAWAVFMAAGYAATMVVTLAQLARRAPDASLAILQRYYATTPHDHSAMTEGDAFRRFIMSDDPTQFMSELDQPGMERVLPRAVTSPGAPLGPAAAVAATVGRTAPALVLLAVAAGLAVARRSRRQGTAGSAMAVPAASA